MSNFTQCPDARLDYVVDWKDWLEELDVIAASEWDSDSSVVFDGQSFTETQAISFISAGTAGRSHKITNTITTTAGRRNCQSFTLQIPRD